MDLMKDYVKSAPLSILERARDVSTRLAREAGLVIRDILEERGECLSGLCFAVVGSVGRKEALEASDLDLVPVAVDDGRLSQYAPHDADLRRELESRLGVKVSKGQDLTKATSITELVEVDSIGGTADNSGRLTKRVLLLTESMYIAGSLPIRTVREAILEAYAKEDRTSGRHFLALCNDIARYYKTLCIEYKAKIDEQDKDWCTRNIKLRHSRKIWYFSNIITVATLADRHPLGDQGFAESLLASFERSPLERIADALRVTQPLAIGRLSKAYALYLQFMSCSENREALAKVKHEDRYRMSLDNPFPAMKFGSDIIHQEIMSMIEQVGPGMRARIIGWFLL